MLLRSSTPTPLSPMPGCQSERTAIDRSLETRTEGFHSNGAPLFY
jgi:hypothetical protein